MFVPLTTAGSWAFILIVGLGLSVLIVLSLLTFIASLVGKYFHSADRKAFKRRQGIK